MKKIKVLNLDLLGLNIKINIQINKKIKQAKICSLCGIVKLLKDFRDINILSCITKDSRCKRCLKKINKENKKCKKVIIMEDSIKGILKEIYYYRYINNGLKMISIKKKNKLKN